MCPYALVKLYKHFDACNYPPGGVIIRDYICGYPLDGVAEEVELSSKELVPGDQIIYIKYINDI